jgi:hypothetical protein
VPLVRAQLYATDTVGSSVPWTTYAGGWRPARVGPSGSAAPSHRYHPGIAAKRSQLAARPTRKWHACEVAQRPRPPESVAKAVTRSAIVSATSSAKHSPLECPATYTRAGSTPRSRTAAAMVARTSRRSGLCAGSRADAVSQ